MLRQPVVVPQNKRFGHSGGLIWIAGGFIIRECNMEAFRKTAFFRLENIKGGPDLTVRQMKEGVLTRSIVSRSGDRGVSLAVKIGAKFLLDGEMDSLRFLRLLCLVRACNLIRRDAAPTMIQDVATMTLQGSTCGAAFSFSEFRWDMRAGQTRTRYESVERALSSCRRHACDCGDIRRALVFVMFAISQASVDFFEPASIGEYPLM